MSFNTRDVTQGGQVTFMRWRMFLQINSILTYYLIITLVVVMTSSLFIRMGWQNIKNGIIYWWVVSYNPLQKHMVKKTVYHLNYYGKKLSFTTEQILSDPYTTYCGKLLAQELLICFIIGLVSVFIITGMIYWYLGHQGKMQSADEITGGRILSESPKDVARMMKKCGLASDIHIDQLPIVSNSEIQNFAMHGSVGTGKSQLIRKFLEQCRERGDLVIIYDKGCTFIREFYDPSNDHVLNPLDKRCANWDLWEECPRISDLETVANTLIPMGASEDPFWQGSSRTIFAEGTEKLRQDSGRSYNKLLRTLLAINLDKLRLVLAGTPASTLVDGKIEKTAISIRSVLTNYVKAMRYLQGIERSGKPKFTIREWMQGVKDGEKNGWLFITSNQRHHESLKPVISMWLSIAANSLLSMGENRERRVWFWYDELKSLHKLPALPEIMAEARKFGGCFGLGFQNYPQLEEIYGTKAAEGMFDLLNTKFFFRSPSAMVAKFVEEELGETVKKKFSEQTSFGNDEVRDGVSFGKDEKRDSVVSYTDIQKLFDMNCYVTLPGDFPVVKMALEYVSRPDVAEEFIPREFQESLDETVDQELEKRETESSGWGALFDDSAEAQSSNSHAPQANSNNAPIVCPGSKLVKKTASKAAIPHTNAATAAAVTTAPASSNEASGGRDDELDFPPPGVSSDGEVINANAYEIHQQMPKTRDAVRREEVNINHSHVEREDMGDFTL